MKTFNSLIDKDLENWFEEFLTQKLALPNYYSSPGQIALVTLDPNQEPGHHLEIDGIMLLHKTIVLFEYTGQGGNYRDKIKKFLRNANLFITSTHLSKRDKLKLFNIPEDRLDDFEDADSWKLVYFGTHEGFENKNYHRGDFPDLPQVQNLLYIIKPSQLEYLRQLVTLIGKFGRNELLAALDFKPADLGEADESLHLPFIKADGKYITSNTDKRADVYLVKFKVADLLNIARVSRYEGIPFILEGREVDNYQRFLIPEKLDNIAEKFIEKKAKKTFPNTITIALSNDCIEEQKNGEPRLTIPKKYSSIDIIDGQHRLFGYTHASITDAIRNDAEILASAIKFRECTPEEATKQCAKVFCEINSTQASVKKDLLYLIKYDVLGDRDIHALAGKVILDCNNRDKVLGGMFLINSLRQKNPLNLLCLEVTGIIDDDLIPFMMGRKIDDTEISDAEFTRVFEMSKVDAQTDPDAFCSKTMVLLEHYFNFVRSVFPNDWRENAETLLISAGYFSAFIRFLRLHLFDNGVAIADMRAHLSGLKDKIDLITQPNQSPSFPKANGTIPSATAEPKIIYDFIVTPPPPETTV